MSVKVRPRLAASRFVRLERGTTTEPQSRSASAQEHHAGKNTDAKAIPTGIQAERVKKMKTGMGHN
jgi:hypothetical protein